MKKFSLFICVIIIHLWGYAQPPSLERTQMEKERQNIQSEIKKIQTEYDNIKDKQHLAIGALTLLNRKIELQQQYISNINKELTVLDDDIYASNIEIYRLQKQLDTLKKQYSKSIVYAYRNRSNYDYLNFIFSANSFNDAVKRINYLKTYRELREKQVEHIKETQKLIEQRQQQQQVRSGQKKSALDNQTSQQEVLKDQHVIKASVVNHLQSQAEELRAQIAAKKKRDRYLNGQISIIIRREITKKNEEAKAEAKRKALEDIAKNNKTAISTVNTKSTTSTPKVIVENKNNSPIKATPIFSSDADIKLNAGFEANRGALPWPVDQHSIKIHYGRYAVEGIRGVEGDNTAVTISTPSVGVAAKTVFDGEILGVFSAGDDTYTIVIQHGKYSTAYSNLNAVTVNKGDHVITGQTIGKVALDPDGGNMGMIDFRLLINGDSTNPERWLRH